MRNLRKLIQKIILESAASNAKGVQDIVRENLRVEVWGRKRGVSIYMLDENDNQVFRLNVVSRTGNPDVFMVGAAYVEDSKADGFGPLMYDIAMEWTTKVFGKWLTADRGTCEPDAQRVWQFYKDNRIGQDGITAIPLDNHRNVVSPQDDDNVDTMMADDLYYSSNNYQYSLRHPGSEDTIQAVWYSRNGMMYGYKKEPVVIPQLLAMPEIFKIKGGKW